MISWSILIEILFIILFPLALLGLFLAGKKKLAKSLIKPSIVKLIFTFGLGIIYGVWSFVYLSQTIICPDVVGASCGLDMEVFTALLVIHILAFYFLSCLIFRKK